MTGHEIAEKAWRAEKRRRVAAEARVSALKEFAEFVVTLDDPRAESLRRSITLTEIIERAAAALSSPPPTETPHE